MLPPDSPAPAHGSLPTRYFEDVYGANADPWQFATSSYEAAKYEATLAALPQHRYQSAFEIGCSIGVLTARLAPRCDRLLAVDIVPSVLEEARARCAGLPWVEFAAMSVPAAFPDERFDLILLSEVGYYWSPADLEKARAKIIDALLPGGQLILVHWTPFVHDYPLTGDEVHDRFLEETLPSGRLRHLFGRREDRYRLDLFARS